MVAKYKLRSRGTPSTTQALCLKGLSEITLVLGWPPTQKFLGLRHSFLPHEKCAENENALRGFQSEAVFLVLDRLVFSMAFFRGM